MSEHLIWDPLMIQRYNRSGPRYTSYPTAVEFIPTTSDDAELDALSQPTNKPLSLYIHIPFCAHACYYCGCNKIVTKDKDRSITYLDYLLREIDMKATALESSATPSRRVIEQLHLGGGTPTFLSDEQLVKLVNHLTSRFKFSDSDSADYSIEIDPRELGKNTLNTLRSLGFNRVSFGVQDLNLAVQKAVNRVQSEEMIIEVMNTAQALGFRSINIDLIYGLPFQTITTFSQTLDRIITMRPDRLSIFNYAHLPQRFMPQRRINEHDLPAPGEKLSIFGMTIQRLSAAGYHYIGMDHFALPGDELSIAQNAGKLHRNFQGYTTHGNCDLIGLGVSSISQLGDMLAQNHTDLIQWQSAIDDDRLPIFKHRQASHDDNIRKSVIMGLLCHLHVSFVELDTTFAIDSRSYFEDELKNLADMEADGLINISDSAIHITEAGRLMVRQVCMVFDIYRHTALHKDRDINHHITDASKFSKAI